MIIDFTVNINNYIEKILNNYLFFDYICPKCGAKHSFTRHASYKRNICFMKNNNICEEEMCILRLKCNSCNSTHAILPNDVIPYCVYSFSFIINVLTKYYSKDNKIKDICSLFSISFQLIYNFISKLLIFLKSTFSVLNNLGCEVPCTPQKLVLTINLYQQNRDFLYSYLFNTQWMFLMKKFHNILSHPIYIGSFYIEKLSPT
jgi:hypothetical protein